MKIYIGNITLEKTKLYDSEKLPIIIKLTAQERLEIIAMPPNSNLYISVPEELEDHIAKEWIGKIVTSSKI